jgi:hypothetical protein
MHSPFKSVSVCWIDRDIIHILSFLLKQLKSPIDLIRCYISVHGGRWKLNCAPYDCKFG